MREALTTIPATVYAMVCKTMLSATLKGGWGRISSSGAVGVIFAIMPTNVSRSAAILRGKDLADLKRITNNLIFSTITLHSFLERAQRHNSNSITKPGMELKH